MADPADMILPLLRDMRAEMKAQFAEVGDRLDGFGRRLAAMEAVQVSFRQALAGDSLMSKLVTGDFEERIETLERKVRELESQK